jgi:Zn-dependent membrane protease YugP
MREHLELRISRAYSLHTIQGIVLTAIASALSLAFGLLIIGILFGAIALHLAWDLFEDAIIFKMGIKHWLFD